MSSAPLGAGFHLADEVKSSGDPQAHARALAVKMRDNNILWAAFQLPVNPNDVLEMVEAELHREGRLFATWAQGMNPTDELNIVQAVRPDMHLANVENKAEEQAWTTAHLDRLRGLQLIHGQAVIFTQGAFDYDTPGDPTTEKAQARAQRWIIRNFDALPEANLVENANATPAAMLTVAIQLGWTGSRIAPVVYLHNKPDGSETPPSTYNMDGFPRWSAWRYGDISDADLLHMKTWPRPAATTPPPSPKPGISVTEGHRRNIETLALVEQRVGPLGQAAALRNAARLSRAALDGVYTTAKGQALDSFLDTLLKDGG